MTVIYFMILNHDIKQRPQCCDQSNKDDDISLYKTENDNNASSVNLGQTKLINKQKLHSNHSNIRYDKNLRKLTEYNENNIEVGFAYQP